MNDLSVFYEHIFEAAAQSGISVEEALRYAKGCGIDALEVDYGRLSDLEGTKALLDSCDMGVSCVYRFFDMINESAEMCREKYLALFEAAKLLGAKKVLRIPGYFSPRSEKQAQLNAVVMRLNEMCAAAEDHGITVTLEDFDDINSPCCRSDGLLYLMRNVKGLRYTFDMGNFRYCLEDAAECYEKLREYIVHVHCKDRRYIENGGDRTSQSRHPERGTDAELPSGGDRMSQSRHPERGTDAELPSGGDRTSQSRHPKRGTDAELPSGGDRMSQSLHPERGTDAELPSGGDRTSQSRHPKRGTDAELPSGGEAKPDLSGALMYPSVVCEGVIGIEALVKRLLADGYDGTLAIEHFGAVDQLGYMKKSAENLRLAMKG